MTNNADTPLTVDLDRELEQSGWNVISWWVDYRDLAKRLERELAAANAKLASLEDRMKIVDGTNMCLGGLVADKDADRIFFRDKLAATEAKLAEAQRDAERMAQPCCMQFDTCTTSDCVPRPRKYAERYQWLRSRARRTNFANKHHAGDIQVYQWEDRTTMNALGLQELDAAIDSAIAKQEGEVSDPTYDREAIRANPEWELAFTLSEIMNDNAPLGWGKYRYAAGCLLNNYEIRRIAKQEPPCPKP